MVSSLMTSSMALANRTPFTARPPVPCRAVPARARVVAAASQNEGDWKPEQAPSKAVMRAVGALAAVQLAFLPAAGADSIKDLLPDSATSSAAREKMNEKTSNLPTFSDVGDSLKNAVGGTSDPKDIGRAISNNTPDGPDLTKNPKDLAEDAKQGVSRLASKVQNAAPDLSAVNEPLTDRTGLPNPFDKGSGGIPRASDISELAGRAKKEAGALGGDVGNNAGDVKQAGSDIASKAKSAASKAKNVIGDNAGLPSPQEAAEKVKGAVNEVGRKAGGLGDNNPLAGNVPSPQEAGDKLKGKVSEAGRNARNAVPDNAGLFDAITDAGDKAKEAVGANNTGGGDVGANLQNKASQISDKAAEFPGASKSNAAGGPNELADKMKTFSDRVAGQSSTFGAKAQNAVGDNAGLFDGAKDGAKEAGDKTKGAANELGRKAGGLGDSNPLAGKVPSPQEAGDKLKGAVNEVSRKAKNAVGDNAGLPSPQEAADKVKSAVSGGGGGQVGSNLQNKASQISDKAAEFPGASKSNAAGGPNELADKMKSFGSKIASQSK